MRPDVWKRLEFLLEEELEPDWEYAKDLVGLLASIPLQEGRAPDEEILLLTRLAALPVPLAGLSRTGPLRDAARPLAGDRIAHDAPGTAR